MDKKELKGFVKLMLGMLVISAILLYCTCFFNRCNLIEAVQRSETSVYVWLALILNLGAILSFVVMLITEKVKLPTVPGGPWKKEQLLVCRYNGLSSCVLFMLCVSLAVFMFYGAVINFMSGGWDGGFTLAFCAASIMIPGVVIWLYMTRYVLIFYPGGLVYRDLRGNVYTVVDEEVLYVLPIGYGKYRHFRIETKEKTFTWGIKARYYYEAESCALRRYPDWESYDRQNKGE